MSESMQKSCLVLLVVLVFGQGLFGDFVWDDRALTLNNPAFSGSFEEAVSQPFLLDGAGGGSYWRPVVTGALWLQAQAFGDSPFGYHLVSLLLHVVITLLVFSWLRKRIPTDAMAAFVGASIFAVHTSRPETVSWIAGSTDLWMAFFALIGVRLWNGRRLNEGRSLVVGTCLALALWSKENAVVVLPLLLIEGLWDKRSNVTRMAGVAAVPVVVALGLRLWIGEGAGGADEPAGTRIFLGLSALGHYLQMLVWPFELSVVTGPREVVAGVELFSSLHITLGIVFISGFGFGWWRAGRVASSHQWRSDMLWFVLPLLPVLHLIPLGTPWTAASRYLYLPLLGVCALCARLAAGQSRRLAFLGVAVLVFAVGSWNHVGHFSSDKALWSHELTMNPGNVTAAENLGHAFYRAGERGEAMKAWSDGLKASRESQKRERSRLGLLVLRERVAGIHPNEPEELKGAQEKYHDLMSGASVKLDEGTFPSFSSEGVDDPELLWIPAGRMAQATGQFEEASRLFEQALARRNRSELAWAEFIKTAGLAQDWTGVSVRLQGARASLGQPGWGAALEQQLGRARQMDENMPLPPDAEKSVGKALKASRLASLLGSPYRAWHWLEVAEKEGGLNAVSYWVTRMQWEVSEGRGEEAFVVLENARKTLPGEASKWDAFEAQLRAQLGTISPR